MSAREMLAEAREEYDAARLALAAAEARLKAATRRVYIREFRVAVESVFGPLDPLNEEVTAL